MSWQAALLWTLGIFIALCVGVVCLARTRDDVIPREKIVSHRITPRLPMGSDWK